MASVPGRPGGQPPGVGARPGGSPGRASARPLSPQQAHEQMDAYEQHLTEELKKIKAVRTLMPNPGAPKRGPTR